MNNQNEVCLGALCGCREVAVEYGGSCFVVFSVPSCAACSLEGDKEED
jgi:hypothetical protein